MMEWGFDLLDYWLVYGFGIIVFYFVLNWVVLDWFVYCLQMEIDDYVFGWDLVKWVVY